MQQIFKINSCFGFSNTKIVQNLKFQKTWSNLYSSSSIIKQELTWEQVFPYATQNFEYLKERGRLYIDKTEYFKLLEDLTLENGIIICRPPRFGKTLFLGTLAAYSDIQKKEIYNSLFNNLKIQNLKHDQQSWKNSFHVLRLNLSLGEDISDFRKEMNDLINNTIEKFKKEYNLDFNIGDSMRANLHNAVAAVDSIGGKVLILTDEYDRFSNRLMLERPTEYMTFVKGDKDGTTDRPEAQNPIRTYFEAIKSVQDIYPNTRNVTVGITPITLNDASGANTFTNITLDPKFEGMIGITEQELEDLVNSIPKELLLPLTSEETINLITQSYNGHKYGETILFNPSSTFHFLRQIVRPERLRFKNLKITIEEFKKNQKIISRPFTDPNTLISPNVLKLVLKSGGQQLLNDLVSGKAKGILEDSGTFMQLFNSTDALLSLLFFHGAVSPTQDDQYFQIPNKSVEKLFLNELLHHFGGLQKNAQRFLKEPSCNSLQQLLDCFDKEVQHIKEIEGEIAHVSLIKAVLTSFLYHISLHSDNPDITLEREKSVEKKSSDSKGRIDLCMKNETDKLYVLMEFKYIKVDNPIESIKDVPQNIITAAQNQIKDYTLDVDNTWTRKNLIGIIVKSPKEVQYFIQDL